MKKYQSLQRFVELACSVSLGTLAWGYGVNYMNDALDTIEVVLDMNNPNLGLKQGILTSIITIGAAVGTFITFKIIQHTPRRRLLHIIDLIQISGSTLSIVADFRVMLLARFIQGISCGMNSIIAPIFLKEISPPEIYPLIGGISLIFYGTGITICNSIGIFLPTVQRGDIVDPYFWRIYFLVPSAFSLLRLFFLGLIYQYESPEWSFRVNDQGAIDLFFNHFYRKEYKDEIMEQFQEREQKRSDSQQITIRDLFRTKYYKRTEVALTLCIGQQTTGVNAVVSYSTLIFQEYTSTAISRILTLLISFIKIIFYSTATGVFQKYGRRNPFLIGTGISTLALLLLVFFSATINQFNYTWHLTAGYLVIACIYVYFIGYYHSLGCVTVYMAEILPDQGVAFALAVQWVFSIGVTLSFPVLKYNDLNLLTDVWDHYVLFIIWGFDYIAFDLHVQVYERGQRKKS